VSVRRLIYTAVFVFPRKLFVWFKRYCFVERKAGVQNDTVHLSLHTDC